MGVLCIDDPRDQSQAHNYQTLPDVAELEMKQLRQDLDQSELRLPPRLTWDTEQLLPEHERTTVSVGLQWQSQRLIWLSHMKSQHAFGRLPFVYIRFILDNNFRDLTFVWWKHLDSNLVEKYVWHIEQEMYEEMSCLE